MHDIFSLETQFFLLVRNIGNEISWKYFMFHEMTLKLYFMKCSGRKISQCILSFTERDKRFNHWSLQSLHSLSFFKSFPVWDHTFMTFIWKVGGGWGGGVLKFGRVYESTDLLFIFADGKWVGGQKLFLFFLWTS